VEKTLQFPVLLDLIDERSAAFRTAVMSASSLDLRVPTCPEWTLLDLVRHLGGVHRFWAAAVGAGPSADPPAQPGAQLAEAAPPDRDALLAWSAASTRQLLDALRAAGPDRGCWTWWGPSQSPQVTGAVARHQVQELTVHTYDAQITVGAPQPLPDEAALDGVDEFLSTCVAWKAPWPHEAANVDFHVTEGRSWRISLAADGARITPLPAPAPSASISASAPGTPASSVPGPVPAASALGPGARASSVPGPVPAASALGPGARASSVPGPVPAASAPGPGVPASSVPGTIPAASARGTANEMVLFLYDRIATDTLQIEGDRHLFDLLRAWGDE
jgi:uncharacterized protein (TIGR03083 family)